ncbi:MAG: prolipoprotein diacylglyceryl transferase [Hungatella sp.]|nr:prolipoprotein diacylglyceryl transferase [Hungatella sp.]
MKNDLFSIGGFTLHGYGLMIGIGFLSAYLLSDYRAKKKGLDPDHVFGLALWAIVIGLISAKLLYYLTTIDQIIKNPRLLLDIANGFVVYGGIIGGTIGGYVYCRKYKLEFLKYVDLIMPAVALAQGFGRIGCFLAGCCYGMETAGSFAIVFHDSAYAPNGVPLLPTQLISSAFNFLHFALLMWLSGRLKRDGRIGALYLILYSMGRFVIEFFRGDLIRGNVGTLTTSQFISLFVAAAGVLLWIAADKFYIRSARDL